MNSNSSTVTAELELRLVVAPQTFVPLMASLYYSARDPYAVRMAFHIGLDEPVEWLFARDLLACDPEASEDAGDVRIWLSADPQDDPQDGPIGGFLNIELSPSSERARFQAPIGEVANFLHRTYEIVPAGLEGAHIDVDAELSDLLGNPF